MSHASLLWGLLACQRGEPPPAPVELPVVLTADPAAEGAGWTVQRLELRGAELRAEGPVTELARWSGPALIAEAQAHPGHNASGGVALELLDPWTGEPLLGDVALGEGQGVEGRLATASFHLTGLTLEAAQAGAAGLPLRIERTFERAVPGVRAQGSLRADRPQQGRLTVALGPLLQALPVTLADSNGDGRLGAEDEGVENAVIFAVTSVAAWSFVVEEP